MNFDETLKSINEKLGEETFGTISDDVANIMGYEESLRKTIEEKEEKINKLTKKNEMLVEANGNLLQKVSAGLEPKKEEKEEDKKKIDLRAAFDKNGNFIK